MHSILYILYTYNMYACFAYMCISTSCMCNAQRLEERASDPLKRVPDSCELLYECLEPNWSFVRSVITLNC